MIFLIASTYPAQKCLPTILNITVPGCTFAELKQATNSELNNLYSWLKANKLSLNIAKTEFMEISTRQKFLAENYREINIQLDGHPICRVEHAKSLGLIIDDRLSWSNHVKELCRKISSAIGAPRRITSLIPQSTAVQIYNALIQPHFDYCAPVWDGLSSYPPFMKFKPRQTQACFLKL